MYIRDGGPLALSPLDGDWREGGAHLLSWIYCDGFNFQKFDSDLIDILWKPQFYYEC